MMHVLCASPPDGGAYNYLLNRFVGVDPCTLNGVDHTVWYSGENAGTAEIVRRRWTVSQRIVVMKTASSALSCGLYVRVTMLLQCEVHIQHT